MLCYGEHIISATKPTRILAVLQNLRKAASFTIAVQLLQNHTLPVLPNPTLPVVTPATLALISLTDDHNISLLASCHYGHAGLAQLCQ